MEFNLSIAQDAEYDIQDAFNWYELKNVNLSLRFEKELNNAIENILKNPFKFQIRYSDIRVNFLKKFPYGIHYFLTQNEIIIVALFHTANNPKKWLDR